MRLSTHLPSFATAARELAYWTQVVVHPTTAARLTEAAGATAVTHATAAADQILHDLPPAPSGPDRLVLSVDGAMVPLRHGQWAEVRTLAVGVPQATTTREGQPCVTSTDLSYFSRMTDSTTFGDLATVEIQRRGVERAGQVAAVVDGAVWCQTFLDLHAPTAVRILDFPHAASYVDGIGQTTGPAGPLLDALERTKLCRTLKQDGPADVLTRLRTVVADAGTPGETSTQLAYLEQRQAQLAYPAFQAADWPIGSGMVESANKLVVEARLKGAGMHWAPDHVNPMLALRTAICSDRWTEVWTQIEDDQRQAARSRRWERQQHRRAAKRERDTAAGALVAPSTAPVGDPPPAPPPAPAEPPPKRAHPWRKPWSVRRQRELATTA
ncbi:MAG: hypothetical protein PVSMB4_18760 [Ktedonobacterales bacterium]